MKFDNTVADILIEMSVIRRSPLYTKTNEIENIIAVAIYDKKNGLHLYRG